MKNPPNLVPPSPLEPDSTCFLLREVCALASAAIRVSRDRPNLIHDEDDDDRADRIHLLRQTMAQIGWVADVALRKMGDGGVFESAEDWMLPGV